MSLEECFEKGLLRKEIISRNKIINSVKLSKRFLNSAKANLKINEYEMCFIATYNSMFHAARSMLFSFGVSERSHKCMIEFLLDKIKDKDILKYLQILDSYRIMRHKIHYAGNLVSKEDVEESIHDAEEFLSLVKKYIS